MLGDDALVYAHRLSEWTSSAPDLEEDIALANIALDLLGQARLLLARAAAADPGVVPGLPPGSPVPPEDALAFFRDEAAFRNVRLVEARQRRLRGHDRPAAGLLHLPPRAAASGWRPAATRCSPRSPPRASTSSPTTATTPARWFLDPGPGHRRVAPPAAGRPCPGLAAARRARSAPTRSSDSSAAQGVGVDPATVAGEVDARARAGLRDQSASSGPNSRRWAVAAAWARRRPHRGDGPPARRDCRSSPGPTRWAGGERDRRLRRSRAAVVPTPSCRC